MKPEELKKLDAYFKRTLNPNITVKARPRKNDSAEVYLGVNYSGEPPRRLVGWQKVYLRPGESKPVRVSVTERAQSVWDTARNNWQYVPGSAVYVGASSRDIRLQSR